MQKNVHDFNKQWCHKYLRNRGLIIHNFWITGLRPESKSLDPNPVPLPLCSAIYWHCNTLDEPPCQCLQSNGWILGIKEIFFSIKYAQAWLVNMNLLCIVALLRPLEFFCLVHCSFYYSHFEKYCRRAIKMFLFEGMTDLLACHSFQFMIL